MEPSVAIHLASFQLRPRAEVGPDQALEKLFLVVSLVNWETLELNLNSASQSFSILSENILAIFMFCF